MGKRIEKYYTLWIEATDEDTKKWIKGAENLPGDEYISVIVSFGSSIVDDQPDIRKIRQQGIDRLNDRIEKLEAFKVSSALLLEEYSAELRYLLEGKSEWFGWSVVKSVVLITWNQLCSMAKLLHS